VGTAQACSRGMASAQGKREVLHSKARSVQAAGKLHSQATQRASGREADGRAHGLDIFNEF
jgi:hypothetical protein